MRYFTEALVIAIVAFYIPKLTLNINELLMIALTGAFSLMILDLYAPQVGVALRYGMGGTLGYKNVDTPVSLFGGGVAGDYVKGLGCALQGYKEGTQQFDECVAAANDNQNMNGGNDQVTTSILNRNNINVNQARNNRIYN
jgi:hypothetical protein